MYIKTGNKTHPCLAYHPSKDSVSFVLAETPPEALGTIIDLCGDDGFVMAERQVADYLRREVQGNTLTLTNLPLPEPAPEPEPPAQQLTTEEAIMEMVTDHEYRLSMIEIGGMT